MTSGDELDQVLCFALATAAALGEPSATSPQLSASACPDCRDSTSKMTLERHRSASQPPPSTHLQPATASVTRSRGFGLRRDSVPLPPKLSMSPRSAATSLLDRISPSPTLQSRLRALLVDAGSETDFSDAASSRSETPAPDSNDDSEYVADVDGSDSGSTYLTEPDDESCADAGNAAGRDDDEEDGEGSDASDDASQRSASVIEHEGVHEDEDHRASTPETSPKERTPGSSEPSKVSTPENKSSDHDVDPSSEGSAGKKDGSSSRKLPEPDQPPKPVKEAEEEVSVLSPRSKGERRTDVEQVVEMVLERLPLPSPPVSASSSIKVDEEMDEETITEALLEDIIYDLVNLSVEDEQMDVDNMWAGAPDQLDKFDFRSAHLEGASDPAASSLTQWIDDRTPASMVPQAATPPPDNVAPRDIFGCNTSQLCSVERLVGHLNIPARTTSPFELSEEARSILVSSPSRPSTPSGHDGSGMPLVMPSSGRAVSVLGKRRSSLPRDPHRASSPSRLRRMTDDVDSRAPRRRSTYEPVRCNA